MADTPVSYKDPTYDALDAKVTAKLDLPEGLLAGIRTKGERSNADQVSEAGAKSVYQIIPTTRDAVLKKYGVDAYLNKENAAEAAGLLLKESLERNKGDAALAIAEYHGGTDRANWGPKTKAYVGRVAVGGLPVAARAPAGAPIAPGESTFDRVMAQMSKPQESAMASVLQAYQSGQMSPEDAKSFEGEVNAGRVMLPRGASLKTAEPASSGAMELPPAVVAAYKSGRMDPADRAQLDQAIQSGSVRLPAGAEAIPGQAPGVAPAPDGTIPQGPQADPTIGDRIIGAGEAALNVGTGLTGGAVGTIAGTAKGITGAILDGSFGSPEAAKMVEQAAAGGAQALTYQPRTPQGRAQAGAVGEVLAQTIPAMPLTGELAIAGRALSALKPTVAAIPPVVRNAVGTAATSVAEGVKAIPERVGRMVGREPAPAKPTPGTMGSVGAMGVDMATQRRMAAQELPVPVELTKGQAERTFEQQRFEQETAKSPTLGAPLRERFADQNQAVLRNFDSWIDQTGAEAPDLRATGMAVDKALVARAARDKAEVRVAYKNAEKAGEMEAPVTLNKLIDHLNDSAPDAATAPLLDVARARAIRLGVAAEGADGALVPQPVPLKIAETYRQAISRATDYEPTNVRQSTIIKGLVDEATDGMGGGLYRQARATRARYAQNYQNRATISQLLSTKKGTADRQVAFEDVFDHTIRKGSLDDVRNVRRILQTGGEDGAQAWKELQGQAVTYIRDQATKNVARDTRGNQIISAAGLDKAIRSLDADGKLDFIFGKKGAEQLRSINDLAKVIYTAPPGSVNTSNTASVLLAALDMATSGAAGMPLPVMSGLRLIVNNVKDRRIQKRVNEAISPAQGRRKPTIH